MNLTVIMGVVIAVLLVTTAAAGKWAMHQTEARAEIEGKYNAFVDGVKEAGDKAEKKRKEKEAETAKNLNTAVTERDAALNRLRDNARKGAGSRGLPKAPTATAGSNQICIPTATYNTAFGEFGKELFRFVEAARGYAIEGDEAQIDAQTLLKGWPK